MKTTILKNILLATTTLVMVIVLITFSAMVLETIKNICEEESYKLSTNGIINLFK